MPDLSTPLVHSNHSSSHASDLFYPLKYDSRRLERTNTNIAKETGRNIFLKDHIMHVYHFLASSCMVLDMYPFIPSLAPVALSRAISLVKRVAIIKKLETKETY